MNLRLIAACSTWAVHLSHCIDVHKFKVSDWLIAQKIFSISQNNFKIDRYGQSLIFVHKK